MSVTNTYASGDISVDIVYSAEENTLTVSGTVPYERNRIPMTLQIKRSGVIVGVAETLAVTKTADGVSYSFSPVKISSSTRSGTLTFDITASLINLKKSVTFNYKGIDSQLEALKMINSSGTLGNTSGMNESFALTSSDLSVTGADLSKLSEKGKEAFAKHLISCADYTLPAKGELDEVVVSCYVNSDFYMLLANYSYTDSKKVHLRDNYIDVCLGRPQAELPHDITLNPRELKVLKVASWSEEAK